MEDCHSQNWIIVKCGLTKSDENWALSEITFMWESIYNIVIPILFYSDLNNPEESPIGFSKDSPTAAGKVYEIMFNHVYIFS